MRLTSILAALSLVGCGSVNPGNMLALSQLSPLTADPSGIRAGIDLPVGVTIPPDGAVLTFAATRSDTGQADMGVFELERLETAQGMLLFRLAPEDRAEYIRLRDMFDAWETEAPRATNGTFSIAVAACKTGSGPDSEATFSVYVATAADAPLAVVVEDAPIGEALEAARNAGASALCD
ncbi:hypothetical protein [Marivita sp. XM-24bin2]|uniref:hypothetical protein n=1 Tax=unclassified Marivita TaxID=2632480 RepID=UPI000D7AD0E0|nr:hypothetical protein [Marivita sp. XM-24bin2]PWL35675.1 MAG: hypothetical protein DCO97_07830 [Marivita sp. XM-24bin2]